MKTYHYVLVVVVLFALGSLYFNSAGKNIQDIKQPEIKPDTSGLPQLYNSSKYNFRINLPEDFKVDEKHEYFSTPIKSFLGVKFVPPKSLSDGTNLSADSYISFESAFSSKDSCNAQNFLDTSELKGMTDFGGRTYTIAYTIGAGAGNFYEEYVYATPIGDMCVGLRYFIHYSNIANYSEGAVKEFNKDELLKLFDSIRLTLTIK